MPTSHHGKTDDLLRIGEAARRLSVSVDTLRRWDADDRIAVVRMPTGERRFRESEIERILRSGEPEPTEVAS